MITDHLWASGHRDHMTVKPSERPKTLRTLKGTSSSERAAPPWRRPDWFHWFRLTEPSRGNTGTSCGCVFPLVSSLLLNSPMTWPRSPAEWCSCCVSRSPCGSSVWPPSSLPTRELFTKFSGSFSGSFPVGSGDSAPLSDGSSADGPNENLRLLSTYSKSWSPAPTRRRNSRLSREAAGCRNKTSYTFFQIKVHTTSSPRPTNRWWKLMKK